MLQPIRTKFRKAHKGRIHGVASSAATLAFGQFGLKALEPDRVTGGIGIDREDERVEIDNRCVVDGDNFVVGHDFALSGR